ncbi:Asp/Glu/hydantoin racemase [Aminobacter sp. AP02]|nr:aspartate/glutamate racemase family protein [Aminobacter sp. AP02]PWK69726.1 Asp/Glu/hydantoin racemase [Aminobacter sp. AP02]
MTVRQTKLIGLLGDMSWEASVLYYRLINQVAHRRMGGHHNARSQMFRPDFDELNALAAQGDWTGVAAVVSDAAATLEKAGAEFALLTAVTPHTVADQLAGAIGMPMLHIADPTGEAILAKGLARVGSWASSPSACRHGSASR